MGTVVAKKRKLTRRGSTAGKVSKAKPKAKRRTRAKSAAATTK